MSERAPRGGVACWIVGRELPHLKAGAAGASWLVERHLQSCRRCQSELSGLDRLEGLLAEAFVRPPAPSTALEARVRDAIERERRARGAGAPAGSGRLWRLMWASSAIAVGALLAALGWSQRDLLTEPPRQVVVRLPPGYAVAAVPEITVVRASGELESR